MCVRNSLDLRCRGFSFFLLRCLSLPVSNRVFPSFIVLKIKTTNWLNQFNNLLSTERLELLKKQQQQQLWRDKGRRFVSIVYKRVSVNVGWYFSVTFPLTNCFGFKLVGKLLVWLLVYLISGSSTSTMWEVLVYTICVCMCYGKTLNFFFDSFALVLGIVVVVVIDTAYFITLFDSKLHCLQSVKLRSIYFSLNQPSSKSIIVCVC